ncbi:hypothetical protein JCM11641_005906 [Rhodosporidiobolus odoratus]
MALCTQIRTALIHETSKYATNIAISTLDVAAGEWAIREAQKDLDLYLPDELVDSRTIASPWRLGRIRDELYGRYVNKDDHLKAGVKWEALLATLEGWFSFMSVSDLDTKLLEIAERLNEATPLQRNNRFVKALRPDIKMHLYREKGLRGSNRKEKILYRDMAKEARNIKQALRMLDTQSGFSQPQRRQESNNNGSYLRPSLSGRDNSRNGNNNSRSHRDCLLSDRWAHFSSQ